MKDEIFKEAKNFLYPSWCKAMGVLSEESNSKEILARFAFFLAPYELEEVESLDNLREILNVIQQFNFHKSA